MAIYVDDLARRGWFLRGRPVASSHMIADTVEELHAFASKIGLKRTWAQLPPKASFPHYDLVASSRGDAIAAGAIVLGRRAFVEVICRIRSETMK